MKYLSVYPQLQYFKTDYAGAENSPLWLMLKIVNTCFTPLHKVIRTKDFLSGIQLQHQTQRTGSTYIMEHPSEGFHPLKKRCKPKAIAQGLTSQTLISISYFLSSWLIILPRRELCKWTHRHPDKALFQMFENINIYKAGKKDQSLKVKSRVCVFCENKLWQCSWFTFHSPPKFSLFSSDPKLDLDITFKHYF